MIYKDNKSLIKRRGTKKLRIANVEKNYTNKLNKIKITNHKVNTAQK